MGYLTRYRPTSSGGGGELIQGADNQLTLDEVYTKYASYYGECHIKGPFDYLIDYLGAITFTVIEDGTIYSAIRNSTAVFDIYVNGNLALSMNGSAPNAHDKYGYTANIGSVNVEIGDIITLKRNNATLNMNWYDIIYPWTYGLGSSYDDFSFTLD